jgi:hypothetical protein
LGARAQAVFAARRFWSLVFIRKAIMFHTGHII